MKKVALCFLVSVLGTSFADSLSDQEVATRVTEMNETLVSIKKWQGQYRKKQRSYQSRASRVLFKNSTEARQYKELAEEAKKNVELLQAQIDSLQLQKEALLNGS